MEMGFIDWMVATGANLYHDIHFALGLPLRRGRHDCDDTIHRKEGIVRIYDIVFDYTVLLDTDAFLRNLFDDTTFQHEMGTAELHYRIGRCLGERIVKGGKDHSSILVTAYRLGIPVYTSSPGDSSIGMNCAASALSGKARKIDVALDVNETAAIVYEAKRKRGKSGVVIVGGGSPKNFMLQTEPHIQEVLGLPESGVAFAVAFAWRGIAHIDPHARGASLGFRLLVTPGVIVLWPLLAWRWASGRTEPPAERNAHRSAARALSGRAPAGAGR